ncbi:MAG: hypothetical protein J6K28_00200 [Alistipes sp.]|nr:hypothetical protein [Alistipes sp.]
MKKSYFAVLSLALVCAGCTKDADMSANRPLEKVTCINVSVGDETRISLGDRGEDGTYPVIWSDGDAVAINGCVSTSVAIDALNPSKASFSFDGVLLETPYDVVYPASAFDADTKCIVLPSVQRYVGGSFDPQAAVLLGHSESAGAVHLKNAMAFMKVTVAAGTHSDPVRFIRIAGNEGEPMCGRFTPDYALATLAGADDIGVYAELDCGENGIALGSEFIVAIPAATYASGITMLIVDTQNHYQVICSTSAFAPAAGTIYASEVTFEPTGTYVDGGIYTAADWRAFAAAADGGVSASYDGSIDEASAATGDWSKWTDADGKVRLMNDITVGDVYWTNDAATISSRVNAISNWKGIFDGNGHTITVKNLRNPLFINVFGTVENLTLKGTAALRTPRSLGSTVAAQLQAGGILRNVTNDVDLTVEYDSNGAALGGICARAFGGVIDGCVNNGKIEISTDASVTASSAGRTAYAGGILGRVGSIATTAFTVPTIAPVVLSNCTNNGAVTVSNDWMADYLAAGGMVGWVCGKTDDAAAALLTMNGCANNGAVAMSGPSNTGRWVTNLGAGVGGMVGFAGRAMSATYIIIGFPYGSQADYCDGYAMKFTDCINRGTVSISNLAGTNAGGTASARSKCCVGGFAGVMFGAIARHAEMTGCKNYGDVIGGVAGSSAAASRSNIVGGMIGYGGCIDMTDCTVKCARIGEDGCSVSAVGGVFGVGFNKFSLENCRIFVETLNYGNIAISATSNSFYGFINGGSTMITRADDDGTAYTALAGSTVRGCKVGGRMVYKHTNGGTYGGEAVINDDESATVEKLFNPLDCAKSSFINSFAVSDTTYWDGVE